VFNPTNIFEFIVNGFYYRAFSEQYFISHCHERIFHVVSDVCYQDGRHQRIVIFAVFRIYTLYRHRVSQKRLSKMGVEII
jgi:hypothetical protein